MKTAYIAQYIANIAMHFLNFTQTPESFLTPTAVISNFWKKKVISFQNNRNNPSYW